MTTEASNVDMKSDSKADSKRDADLCDADLRDADPCDAPLCDADLGAPSSNPQLVVVDATAAGAPSHSINEQKVETTSAGPNAPGGRRKGWFNKPFFAVACVFAATLTGVNAWLGPDRTYSDCELYHHHESVEDRAVRLQKLQLRVRRAEFSRDGAMLRRAAWNLARAYRGNDSVREEAALKEAINADPEPVEAFDLARFDLCDLYMALGRKAEAAQLLDDWLGKRRASDESWMGFWAVPVYEEAARIYDAAGEHEKSAQSASLADMHRLMLMDQGIYYAPSVECARATDAVRAGNYAEASKLLAAAAKSKSPASNMTGAPQPDLHAMAMLPAVAILNGDYALAGKSFDDAFKALAQLEEDEDCAKIYRQLRATLLHAHGKYLMSQGKSHEAAKQFADEQKIYDMILTPVRECWGPGEWTLGGPRHPIIYVDDRREPGVGAR